MKKNGLIGVMLLSLIFTMSACGSKADIGINEIDLKELEKKLDNEESFLLVTFSANEEEVEKSGLVEAFDQAFNEKEETEIYLIVYEVSKEKLDQLGDKYISTE